MLGKRLGINLATANFLAWVAGLRLDFLFLPECVLHYHFKFKRVNQFRRQNAS